MSDDTAQDFFASFRAKFATRPSFASRGGEPESLTESAVEGAIDLSAGANSARLDRTNDELSRIVDRYLKGDPNARAIAKKIAESGGSALTRLRNEDPTLVDDVDARAVVEAIVATDGSRPTFLVVDGKVDPESSILGDWESFLISNANQLNNAIACVGRVDHPGTLAGYVGTGFLIHRDLVLTNRHVLQGIARWSTKGWVLAPNVAIDFGHELNGQNTLNRRFIEDVLFAGAKEINPQALDHTKLDLVVLKLAPWDADVATLEFDISDAWNLTGTHVVTVGYPGPPPAVTLPPNLLDQLFQSHFGYKRLAPGRLTVPVIKNPPAWTLAHDATTLGGNSGSLIIAIGNEGKAAGLHYGGKWSEPRENWGHILADTLDEPDIKTGRSLRSILEEFSVKVQSNTGSSSQVSSTPAVSPNKTPEAPAVTLKPAVIAPATSKPGSSSSLTKFATPFPLSNMQRLAQLSSANRLEAAELEAAGDGETPANNFAGRRGYDPAFLRGWNIPLPRPKSDTRKLRRGGKGDELKYEHFSLIMSASRKLPIITATNIDGSQSRQMPRIAQWSYDGRLDQSDQIGNELYQSNALDRGHMVRREDPVWGDFTTAKRANIDTFHYTNSCPQMAGVNQKIWLGLENYVLSHTREDNMRVSVFTGPFFTKDDPIYRGVAIPLAFWKVIAFQLDNGRSSATAYKVSQAKELQELEFVFSAYKTFQISLRQVADDTGIDFSHLIPFDGFSTHESVHGGRLEEPLQDLSDLRV